MQNLLSFTVIRFVAPQRTVLYKESCSSRFYTKFVFFLVDMYLKRVSVLRLSRILNILQMCKASSVTKKSINIPVKPIYL